MNVLDVSSLSFSSISTWLRCPRQYYFRYVLGKKEPPKISLIEGSAHHAALEENNRHKRMRGFDLKAATVTERFMQELRTLSRAEERLDWGQDSEDGIYIRGRDWHRQYFLEIAPGIEPDLVEEKFEKKVVLNGKPVLITGVVDLGYNKKVSDYKTTSSFGFFSHKRGIGSDLQLSLYSWATGWKKVEKICFVKGSEPRVQAIQAERGKREIAWALQVVGQVLNAIEKGIFPLCDPTAWCCSEKYCGYWKSCRGAGG